MPKRLFDLFFSLFGLNVLWPLFLAVVVLVKLTSPGPVFYVQERIGRQGRRFKIIKFRTMTVGAEKQGSITAATDARITGLGRFLRRFKLDELPQLWNVLAGKMSFVGPRPDVPGYADNLTGSDGDILKLLPGITGPASLFFRNEEELLAGVADPREFNDKVIWPIKLKINRIYFEEMGFWKDVGYILITLVPLLDRLFGLMGRFEGFRGELEERAVALFRHSTFHIKHNLG
jgi:lipopolysaccharide/colanic/teichoic acid biosynthesis glycosyltransferase